MNYNKKTFMDVFHKSKYQIFTIIVKYSNQVKQIEAVGEKSQRALMAYY